MKKITTKEIESILQAMMECNIPVKVYAGIQDLFNKLPAVEEAKSEKK